jgi:hypothetical protein
MKTKQRLLAPQVARALRLPTAPFPGKCLLPWTPKNQRMTLLGGGSPRILGLSACRRASQSWLSENMIALSVYAKKGPRSAWFRMPAQHTIAAKPIGTGTSRSSRDAARCSALISGSGLRGRYRRIYLPAMCGPAPMAAFITRGLRHRSRRWLRGAV